MTQIASLKMAMTMMMIIMMMMLYGLHINPTRIHCTIEVMKEIETNFNGEEVYCKCYLGSDGRFMGYFIMNKVKNSKKHREFFF